MLPVCEGDLPEDGIVGGGGVPLFVVSVVVEGVVGHEGAAVQVGREDEGVVLGPIHYGL